MNTVLTGFDSANSKESSLKTQLCANKKHLFSLCLILGVLSATSAYAEQTAWNQLNPGETTSFKDQGESYEVTTPTEGRYAWLRVRRTHNWTGHSAAFTGRSIESLIPVALEMKHQHLLNWEATLIARHVELGNMSARSAAQWISLFREAEELTDRQLVQRIFILRQYERGSAMALFAAACVPYELDILDAAEQVVRAETSIPARRTLDTTEGFHPPRDAMNLLESSRFTILTTALSTALNGASMRGDIWPLEYSGSASDEQQFPMSVAPDAASSYSSTRQKGLEPSVKDTSSGSVESSSVERPARPCQLDQVSLVAEWAWLTRHRWHELSATIDEIMASNKVPTKLYWRAAVYQYLQTHREAIVAIADGYEAAFPASTNGIVFMRALVDMVDGSFHAPPQQWPTMSQATNPTWLWILAEHLRLRLELEAAATLSARLIDMDANFVAAWLTQSSIAIRRGNLAKARANLHHLEQASPPDSILDYWTQQLSEQIEKVSVTPEYDDK